ncbi:MAG: tetratricopeptide repeat protein [Myxococcales bacterium]|nr:tetratricopeptide repeat protein [Myxococcales bacterium]
MNRLGKLALLVAALFAWPLVSEAAVSDLSSGMLVAKKPAKKPDKKGPAEKKPQDKKPADKKPETRPEDELPTGPAKIQLPTMEEKKGDSAKLDIQLLDSEIEQLKNIVKDYPEGPAKADLYFRLAERYYERSRYVYYTEMQKYDEDVQKWMEAREKNPEAPEPKIDNRGSKVYTDAAMRIYRIIFERYKDYPRRDEVLFTMGYNLYESGEKAEGVKMYWELIKSFPESRFVPDAYLAMGEHYFNSNDVNNAKKAYEKALAFKDSKVYVFALYKLGWCDYNLGEYEKAIEKYKQVAGLAQREAAAGEAGDKNKIQLRRESMQDMVLAYSQIDALEDAKEYYVSQLGESGALEFLRRLARTYETQGKAEMVVKSMRLLLSDYPNDPECPSFHNSIVLAYRKLNQREDVKREVNRLIDQYRPGSQWAEVNKNNKAAIARANNLVEESLRDLVTSYHREAQETKSWDTYNLARGIYAKYLKTFPDSESAYKLRWYYADILYKMGDFFHAADEYAKVVQKDPKGQFSAEAAYDAVLCWERCIELRDKEKIDCTQWKPKTGTAKIHEETKEMKREKIGFVETNISKAATKEDLVAKEIPALEKKFLEATDIFSQVAPKHDMYIPIRFKSAFIFYKYHQYDEMTKRFGEIIERYPTNEYAIKAARLSINTLYLKATASESEDERTKFWGEINHWSKAFKDNKVLVSSPVAVKEKFADELQSLIEESGYNVVLALRQKDALAAASGFDQFVKDYPKSKYAHRALYAAMVIYDEAKQLDLAIDAGKKLLKNYPDSDRINPTIGFLATFHTRVADFDQAARYYEQYFDKWLQQSGEGGKGKKGKPQPKPKAKPAGKGDKEEVEAILITDKEAQDALYNAALLRESIGDHNGAIANFAKYVKHFEDAKDAPDVYFKVGKIYELLGKVREADHIWEGYNEKFGQKSPPGRNLNVLYRHAMALRKLGKEKDSDKLLDKILDGYNQLPEEARDAEARMAASHARFLQIEPEFNTYINTKLVLPPATLKKNLFFKIDTRPKLEKKYEEIVALRDPDWSIASLVRMAQLSQNLSDSMLEAPVPAGLTPEQADIYQEELQKQALPLEEKAITLYRKAIDVSNEKGLYNEWTMKAQDLLREKYEPNAYPEVFRAETASTEYFYLQGPKLDKLEVPDEPEPAALPPPAPAAPAATEQPAS